MKKYSIVLKRIWARLPAYKKYYLGHMRSYFPKISREISDRLDGFEWQDFQKYKTIISNTSILVIFSRHNLSKKKIVFKIPLNKQELNRLELNYNFLRLLENRLALQIPKSILYFEMHPFGYIFVESFLEGINGYTIALKEFSQRESLIDEALKALKEIRRVEIEGKTTITVKDSQDIIQKYQKHIKRNIDSNLAVGFDDVFEKLFWIWKNDKIEVGISHGDYSLANILYLKKERWKVTGVIDWDRFSLDTPLLYDELHVHIFANAIWNNSSVGYEIINCFKDTRFVFKELLFFWIIFISKNIETRPEIFKSKRWVKRNVINVINYIKDFN